VVGVDEAPGPPVVAPVAIEGGLANFVHRGLACVPLEVFDDLGHGVAVLVLEGTDGDLLAVVADQFPVPVLGLEQDGEVADGLDGRSVSDRLDVLDGVLGGVARAEALRGVRDGRTVREDEAPPPLVVRVGVHLEDTGAHRALVGLLDGGDEAVHGVASARFGVVAIAALGDGVADVVDETPAPSLVVLEDLEGGVLDLEVFGVGACSSASSSRPSRRL